MHFTITTSPTPRPSLRDESSLADAHIHILPSPPHLRPRTIQISISKPVEKITLTIPTTEPKTQTILANLINTNLRSQQHYCSTLALKEAETILTKTYGFQWELVATHVNSTPAGTGTAILDVRNDGDSVRCRWASKPEGILYIFDGSLWGYYRYKFGIVGIILNLCVLGGLLALLVLLPMIWWSRGFTWTQAKTVAGVWALVAVVHDGLVNMAMSEHPKMVMEITLKEQTGSLVGGGFLTIEQGTDQRAPDMYEYMYKREK